MATSTYIINRMPIANRALRLLVTVLLWLAVSLACLGVIGIGALIVLFGAAAVFIGALGVLVVNAPEYLYKSIRNNL